LAGTSLIQGLFKQDVNLSKNSITFRPGQILNGKVIKLYPNHMAEVQIGSTKVVAKLETPLTANERQWFQVVPSSDGQVVLKALKLPQTPMNREALTFEALLNKLGVQSNKLSQEIVRFFIQEQLPVSKDTIKLASEWLKNSDSPKEGLDAIKQILVRQLPFTKDAFTSILSNVQGQPMHKMLEGLNLALKAELGNTNQALPLLLDELTASNKETVGNKLANSLVNNWLNVKDQSSSQAAFRVLQTAGLLPSTMNEGQLLLQGLQSLLKEHQAPRILNGNKAELLNVLNVAIQSGKAIDSKQVSMNVLKELHKLIPSLPSQTESIKNADLTLTIKQAMQVVMTDGGSNGNQTSNILKWFQHLGQLPFDQGVSELIKLTVEVTESPSTLIKGDIEKLHSIMKEIQRESIQWNNGESIKETLMSLVKKMGYSFDHDVVNQLKNANDQQLKSFDTLKPHLLQLLNDDPPLPIREGAEKLLQKITGFQLLSQEIGPLQQFAVQVPISFWDKTTDLTMQWSGRKKENGKIDPDHCRVIFYLELEHLKDTVIDMQIQNRIIQVNIMNETEQLQQLAGPLLVQLKEKLAEHQYQLSSVQFHHPKNPQQMIEKKHNPIIFAPSTYSGVDIKI
jgi:hypothetical protein